MLTLMQGVPGSGKSTEARRLADGGGAVICSTDDFHVLPDGTYMYDSDNISYYHAWNQWEVDYWLAQGRDVIVDNTNIRRWQVDPYRKTAQRYRHSVRVVRCTGNFTSIHGVPLEIIQRMRLEMENLLSV